MVQRLIDANALAKLFDAEFKQTMKLIWGGEKHLDNLAEGFTEANRIAKYIAPAVDAVPVVRCRGCKSCRELNRKDRNEEAYADGVLWCSNWREGVWPDDFCSYGVKKEEDKA